MTTKKLLAIAALLVSANTAYAQTAARSDNTAFGTTSAEFLLLGAGARGAALGGSFAAIASDVTALYWNPGGLALMNNPGVAMSTTASTPELSSSAASTSAISTSSSTVSSRGKPSHSVSGASKAMQASSWRNVASSRQALRNPRSENCSARTTRTKLKAVVDFIVVMAGAPSGATSGCACGVDAAWRGGTCIKPMLNHTPTLK